LEKQHVVNYNTLQDKYHTKDTIFLPKTQ